MDKTEQESTGKAGKITAKISDFRNGLRIYEQVQLVRIKSRDCSLLIMEDYFPAIGSIHGDVDLVMEDDVVRMSNVNGFYLHRNNEFSLLIAEETAEERAEAFAVKDDEVEDADTDR